jgi:hypothetical protein
MWQRGARHLAGATTGIPVDTSPLSGRPKPGSALDSVTIPGQVFSGERFPIDVAVEAPRAARPKWNSLPKAKPIGGSQVQLQPV